MSTTIDEKVVEMRFDNKQFEEGVQTSISSLDKLKKSLDLDGAAKGLENVSDSARKCDFSVLSNSVETVKAKFSALEVMGVTALANITNSVVNAGKRILSQFTIEPITTGFNEYELKMGSIQTIMASTGESLDTVNQKLDELNTYSDRTIYSFSDMTSNIGKFTNAGVKLNDAVAAIQGVSNVAAVSGANASEASRAMYNFAQALSSGYVKLIDWKSIENANMATVDFKNQLLETAVAVGTVEKTADGMYNVLTTNAKGAGMDDVIDATHMFNDSLSYQWMTTEVLTETLKKYSDETTDIGKKAFAAAQDVKTFSQLMDTLKESAQSGWASTWQLFVGDFEEAKATLTEFNNFFSSILDSSANARNSLLEGALSRESATSFIANLTGVTEETVGQLRKLGKEGDYTSDEFNELLGTMSGGNDVLGEVITHLAKMSDSGKNVVDYISDITGMTPESIKELKKLGENSNYSSEEFKELCRVLSEGEPVMQATITTLLRMNKSSGRELIFDAILNACKGLQKAFGSLKQAWAEVFPPITSEKLLSLIKSLHEFSERLIISDETADKLKRTFKGLFSVLDIVRNAFSSIFNAVKPLAGRLTTLGSGILDVTARFGDWLVSIDEAVKRSDIFNGIVSKIVDFVTLAAAKVRELIAAFKEKFGTPGFSLLQDILDRIKTRISALVSSVKGLKDGVVDSFDEMGNAIAGSTFFKALTTIFNVVKKVATGIINAISGLVKGIVSKLSGADFTRALDLLNNLSLGSIAVGISKFIKGAGSTLDSLKDVFEKSGGFVEKISGILDGVKGCFVAWQEDIKAGTLLKIAKAIAILAASLVVISLVDSEKLASSLAAMSGMFAELVASMTIYSKLSSSLKPGQSGMTTMIAMATSVLILAAALKKIADLDTGSLVAGLVGIAALAKVMVETMTELQVASKVCEGAAITGLIKFAAAMDLLALSLSIVAKLDVTSLIVGVTGIATLSLILVKSIPALQKASKDCEGATITGLITFAASIGILTLSLRNVAKLDVQGIITGLTGIATLSVILVKSMSALQKASKDCEGASIAGLLTFATSIGLLSASLRIVAKLDIKGLIIGISGVAGLALIMEQTLKSLQKVSKECDGATITGLLTFAAAIELLVLSLKSVAKLDVAGLAKGLVGVAGLATVMGVTLTKLGESIKKSKLDKGKMTELAGSMALLATSIMLLTPAFVILGSLSWETIVKGLISIAGAFAVLGTAGVVLAGLETTILALSASITLVGVGAVALGAGLVLAAAGLTALGTSFGISSAAIVAGISAIIVGIVSLVPSLVKVIANAITAFFDAIAASASSIGNAVKTVVLTVVDVLKECVPAIADGVLSMISGVLAALATYTPGIVDSLMTFLIELINGLAARMPELIQAVVNFLGSLFKGIIDAVSNANTDALLKGIVGVGLITAMMESLSTAAYYTAGAMKGLLGVGVVLVELTAILAAIGGLAQIPGLKWLIDEGGELLQSVGVAIGSFVGGIAGGFMSGMSSQFPKIGADLSGFMANVQPFLDGAKSVNPSTLEGVKSLAGVILALTTADILNAMTSWLTGGSSLADFAEDLVPFGKAINDFGDTVRDLDTDTVSQVAVAGKTLAEMAATLPNSGGVLGFFVGNNDMDVFGEQLVAFGNAISEFSVTVKDIDSNSVENAAAAGKAMAEMATTLPNSGGVVGFFSGNNDMKDFAKQLVPFGEAMRDYSEAVSGLKPEVIESSASAGMALSELANTLPNSGGLVSWFTGDNDLAGFGKDLIKFGEGMKSYAESVDGIDTDAVTSSAAAGKALSELANTIPNCGGLVSFFTGDNDLSTFGKDIVKFGEAMKSYSESISGIDTDAVTASAVAAEALVELQNSLGNVGGIVSMFFGDNDLTKFAQGIIPFGIAMKAYSEAVSGIEASAVSDSATAAMALAELQNSLTNVGGVIEFFAGGNDLEKFAEGLAPFGEGMKAYSEAVTGIDTEAIAASSVAAESLAVLQAALPKVGGVMEFFSGKNDLETFSHGLEPFGEGIKKYSDAISGIDAEAIEASSIAAESLATLQATLPKVGGVMEFFTGKNDLETFSKGLEPFGRAMKTYSEVVSGLDPEAVSASTSAGQALAELETSLPNVGGVVEFFTGGNDLTTFSAGLAPFGEGMKAYSEAVSGIDANAVSASTTAAQALAELQKSLPNVGGVVEFFTGGNDLGKFSEGLAPFGEGMAAYSKAVADVSPEAMEASSSAAKALVELQNSLPNVGGVVEFFLGGKDLGEFGDQLVIFGEGLSKYSASVADVDPNVVVTSANAAGALKSLAEGLPDVGFFDKLFGGENALETFGKGLKKFGESMNDYYKEISGIDMTSLDSSIKSVWNLVELSEGVAAVDSESLKNFGKNLNSMAGEGISKFVQAFTDSDAQVKDAVVSILETMSSAFTANLMIPIDAMTGIIVALAETLDDDPAIENAVLAQMNTMSDAIKSKKNDIKSAVTVIVSAITSTISSMKDSFKQAGVNVGQGFIEGINSKNSGAATAGKNLGLAALNAAKKALDSHSPSKEFIHLGENIGDGLAIGVNNSIVPAEKAASGMIDEVLKVSSKGIEAFENWAEEKKYYGELSLKDELAGYENMQKLYAEGSENRIKIDREVYRIQNELVSSTYQASIDWIEEEKYYNRLSLEQELAAWERVQARYLEGSEERKKADREVYRLRNELIEASYQHSMDWIDEEKYYGRLSLADELAAYKRVQSRYAAGTDERKEMDRKVYELEQEISDAQKQFITDVQNVQAEASQKKLDLEQEYADKVTEINEQLARDIDSLNEQYQSKLESRANSLYQSYGLFDEVQKRESVSGETLMKNLEGQVKEFGDWQDILDSLSAKGLDEELIDELRQMGPSAISQIEALNSMSDDGLDKYVSLWQLKHAQAREQATTELEGLRIETQNSIEQLRIDASNELEEYRRVWQENLRQVDIDAENQITALQQTFAEKIGLIKTSTEKELTEMVQNANKILREAGWSETGQAITAGITSGILSGKSTFITEITQMALAGVEAVKDTLGIQSPSKVFAKLGEYTGLGFVNGLISYAAKSYNAGSEIAENARSGLSTSVNSIANLIESGVNDMQPTITPVLDMSLVSAGMRQMDGMFSAPVAMNLSGQASVRYAYENSIPVSVEVKNDGVIGELQSLRNDMSEMMVRIERMQIVLDTGTLVGEIAQPMDSALGQRAAYRGRRN